MDGAGVPGGSNEGVRGRRACDSTSNAELQMAFVKRVRRVTSLCSERRLNQVWLRCLIEVDWLRTVGLGGQVAELAIHIHMVPELGGDYCGEAEFDGEAWK